MSEPKKVEPYENGEAMWRGCCADYGVITARLVCRGFAETERFTAHKGDLEFIRQLREAMTSAPNMADVPVYLHNRRFAELCGESALYDESERVNRLCADDVDTAMFACKYSGRDRYAFAHALAALRDQYGLERVRLVLAAEAAWLGMVGRASNDVGEWAHDLKLGDHFYGGFHLRTRPDALEGLIGELRKVMELEREKQSAPVIEAKEDDIMATNTNGFPSRETVAMLREQYPAGTRVELISMDDPYTTLRAGDKGAVAFVDAEQSGVTVQGGVHINWDNGSTLAAIYGVDSFKKAECEITPPQQGQPRKSAQAARRSDGFTSVLGAIDSGKKAPKPPRKAKAQGKTKSDREER